MCDNYVVIDLHFGFCLGKRSRYCDVSNYFLLPFKPILNMSSSCKGFLAVRRISELKYVACRV